MDKTTKAFVIAACSVVIATPVVWLGTEILKAYRYNEFQRAVQEKAELDQQKKAERDRKVNRSLPCIKEADELFPLSSDGNIMEQITEKSNWLESCVDSNEPVETFTTP